MKILYHNWLCPFSRKVLALLEEKEIEFDLKIENPWERKNEFLVLNPAGNVPVLIEENGQPFSFHYSICEYIESYYKDKPLISDDVFKAAEQRRIEAWFDNKFYYEVSQNLVFEKLEKWIRNLGSPNSAKISAGRKNLITHMQYIEWLTERRKWLAGDTLSRADITAAAHLSLVDYLGDIKWEHYPEAKQWYARIKSRPCFRKILNTKIYGFEPSKDYNNLDF